MMHVYICGICLLLVVCLQRLNSAIIYDRDFGYSYFGFKTLERSYLLRIDGEGNESMYYRRTIYGSVLPNPLIGRLTDCACLHIKGVLGS